VLQLNSSKLFKKSTMNHKKKQKYLIRVRTAPLSFLSGESVNSLVEKSDGALEGNDGALEGNDGDQRKKEERVLKILPQPLEVVDTIYHNLKGEQVLLARISFAQGNI